MVVSETGSIVVVWQEKKGEITKELPALMFLVLDRLYLQLRREVD
ncbi:MAG TPA: hypothetical protein PLN69_02075 [bacterium]|nr:hypothetical protein [bacterium]